MTAVISSEKDKDQEDEAPLSDQSYARKLYPLSLENATPRTSPPGLIVKLLQTSHIPAWHQKLIKWRLMKVRVILCSCLHLTEMSCNSMGW